MEIHVYYRYWYFGGALVGLWHILQFLKLNNCNNTYIGLVQDSITFAILICWSSANSYTPWNLNPKLIKTTATISMPHPMHLHHKWSLRMGNFFSFVFLRSEGSITSQSVTSWCTKQRSHLNVCALHHRYFLRCKTRHTAQYRRREVNATSVSTKLVTSPGCLGK